MKWTFESIVEFFLFLREIEVLKTKKKKEKEEVAKDVDAATMLITFRETTAWIPGR